jgi:hypothetical protein
MVDRFIVGLSVPLWKEPIVQKVLWDLCRLVGVGEDSNRKTKCCGLKRAAVRPKPISLVTELLKTVISFIEDTQEENL